jgi:hypothetical protein
MMRMTDVEQVRAYMRTGPRPDVAPDVAATRTTTRLKQRIAALSARLSHAVFLGMIGLALLPRPQTLAERAVALPAPQLPAQTTSKAAAVAAPLKPSIVTQAQFKSAASEAPKASPRAAPSPKDLPLIVTRLTDLPPARLIAPTLAPIRTVTLLPLSKREAVKLMPPPRSTLKVTEREIKIVVDAEPVTSVAPPPKPEKPAPAIGVTKKSRPFTVVNAWSNEQIAEARAACARIITSTDIVATEAAPVREGSCGAPAPITVSQIGAPKVKIHPAAMLTCPMAAALNTWMTAKVQPAALAAFGVPVTRLISASSYSCRNRYGRTDTQLSEHALINALDLSGFVLADGRTVRVLQDWGPVARDTVKPELKPDTKPDIPIPAPVAVAVTVQTAKPSFKAGLSLLGGKSLAKFISAKDVEAAQAGMAKAPDATATDKAKEPKPASVEPDFKARRSEFLRRVHTGACDVFGTVLGPESNDAHRNHFHFDMKPRRHKGFCQ